MTIKTPERRTVPVDPPSVRLSNSCDAATLKDSYAPLILAAANHPFVVAQLGQSLDGRIATVSGESQWINGPGALDHLHRLRALVDAVVVGVGTVISDDPMLTVRRISGQNPARVVIDPSGRAPLGVRCMARDGARRIVVTASEFRGPKDVEVVTLPRINGKIRCEAIITSLFSRGLRRILIEGGASTVSAFIDADAVDRLHILAAPLILGSGKIGLELSPVACLEKARRPRVKTYQLGGGDVLFDCDMKAAKD